MRDIRQALRVLLGSPAVTLTALSILALGIGTTAAIFTVTSRVLFRPLPFAAPERLVHFGTVGILEFRQYRERSRSFDSLVSYAVVNRNLQDVEAPERLSAVATEPGLFDLLGVPPLVGRTFNSADPPTVAVVSEAFWRRRFAGQTSLEGRTITLDGTPFTVIGIMPGGFQFPYGTPLDVWIPIELPRTESWFQRIDAAVGRLKEHVPLASARAELRAIAQGIEPLSQSNPARTVVMTPLDEAVVGRSRRGLLILFGAAGCVLLIACANVGNLLLSRAEDRKREIAVRIAVGASHGQLTRQFLTESLLLVLAATAAALFVAIGGTRLLVVFAAPQIPRASEIAVDWTVFLFLLAIGLTSGVVFGLVPALHALKSNVSEALTTGGSRSSRGRKSTALAGALVGAEMALAFILLVGAGLLLRAFIGLQQAPTGLAADHVLTLRLEGRAVAGTQSPSTDGDADATIQGRYFRAIEDRVKQIPGVGEAGFVTRLHIQSPGNGGQFTIPGRTTPANPRGFPVRLREASPGYFRALGIPLRNGQVFADGDPGVVVNEALVREHFPGADPIGRILNRGTIVGVVGDVRQNLRQPAEPEIFSSLARTSYSAATLVIRSELPPASLVGAVRAALRDVNPTQAVFEVRTMNDVIMASHGDLNLSLWLVGLFAGLALLLSIAGIYGVVSYNVAARRREFGIRVALGADPRRLLQLMSTQGLRLILPGLAVGLTGAVALTRLLRTLLYEVSPTDPVTYLVVTGVIASIAMAACLVPARRTLSADPTTLLRTD